MIGYSQESSKIKVKDNKLKISQMTVTQNYSNDSYSKLLSAHCSILLIAQSYSLLICSILLSLKVKVKVREYT